ncbi:MAG: hypothetical protein A2Y48_09520 [Nitrospirae bacterium RIFCSPLOW2_12_42_9]|nr:MAG: hypothetical protein A3D21_03040 [Nitrospirae bacterium RIFCSPHIGHO2_02_FULL_42_12]OGW59535.1 MAG: hypothetical protein A2Y48_09520 [Nitrospirae bacterium RIFCSPLOW2_12_42_9]HAS16538.1 hypothetical protein [Nitrospiraceae bacterium]HBI23530.1 hypothetical protein [Nitrospiraceae bacterium]
MAKVIKATVIDETHLELSQPISTQRGVHINILIADDHEDDRLWQEASKKHLLKAYDEEDAIYDRL